MKNTMLVALLAASALAQDQFTFVTTLSNTTMVIPVVTKRAAEVTTPVMSGMSMAMPSRVPVDMSSKMHHMSMGDDEDDGEENEMADIYGRGESTKRCFPRSKQDSTIFTPITIPDSHTETTVLPVPIPITVSETTTATVSHRISHTRVNVVVAPTTESTTSTRTLQLVSTATTTTTLTETEVQHATAHDDRLIDIGFFKTVTETATVTGYPYLDVKKIQEDEERRKNGKDIQTTDSVSDKSEAGRVGVAGVGAALLAAVFVALLM